MLEDKMFAFAMLGSEWVLWLLVALSAICITIAVERVIFVSQNRTSMSSLQPILIQFLEGGSSESFHNDLNTLSPFINSKNFLSSTREKPVVPEIIAGLYEDFLIAFSRRSVPFELVKSIITSEQLISSFTSLLTTKFSFFSPMDL